MFCSLCSSHKAHLNVIASSERLKNNGPIYIVCGSPAVTGEELCLLAMLPRVISSGKGSQQGKMLSKVNDAVSNRLELTRHKMASLWANI